MKLKQIAYEFNPGITYPAYLTRSRLLRSIAGHAGKLKGVLMDFGCGSKPYKSLFEVDKYIGVDFENPGHPHLNEQIDVFYDGHSIPFEDNHFDSVFSSEVFEHIFNLDEILKEINRVMKPGGMLLITCPFSICEHEVPHDFARYSSFGIKSMLERNGFEIIQQNKTGNSIETVSQLRIMYIHQHITPHIRKIPILRSVFRFIVYTGINLYAVVLSKIFPAGEDLYLNNVVLCRRK
ncbi:MAG TPA: methyltransferase domain-containing protein [Panacibacter sp.]|nr:methyltransferase domain-containing protein [Panacibacter sp.]HNP45626.1 methyltransferase domain-containing protein [Panacibacter sp.]